MKHGSFFTGLACLLGACASEAPRASTATRSAPTPAAAPSPNAAPRSEAPRDKGQEIVDATLKQVAAARMLAPMRSVRSEVIGRSELLGRMKQELAEDLEPELLQGSTELLYALGAAPADLDYLGSMLTLLTTQLAGFYDPREKEMVLLDDLGMEAQQATLWHELVHALQDQHYDLKPLMKWQPGRGDALSAVQALAEGDATSAMMDLMLLPRGQTALDLPEGMLAGSLGMMEAMPEIASVPRILKRGIVAPYVDGLSFVHARRRAGGWAAVDAAWRELPTTSEQILHPEKYSAHEGAEIVPVPPPFPGGPDHVVYRDVLGEEAIRIALEEWVPRVTAVDSAAGWSGDIVAVFAAGDRRAVGIRLRYDDEAHAKRGFQAFARGALLPETEPSSMDPPPASVSAQQTLAAVRKRSVCQMRSHRGPFAVVWRGRDLGVALGPYQRVGSATQSLSECGPALGWATSILEAN